MKFLNNTKSLVNLVLMIFLFLASCYLLLTMAFEIEDREKFNLCKQRAFSNYMKEWNSQCKQNNKSEECEHLPFASATQLNSDLIEQQSICAKLYR
jgi:hypothetical protein